MLPSWIWIHSTSRLSAFIIFNEAYIERTYYYQKSRNSGCRLGAHPEIKMRVKE